MAHFVAAEVVGGGEARMVASLLKEEREETLKVRQSFSLDGSGSQLGGMF